MTSHDEFRSLLAGTDTPLSPDPLFARRLRKQYLAEIEPTSASASSHAATFGEPRRNRMFDLAAVAILALSMIGGLIGIRSNTIGLPTPTVQAASTPLASPVTAVGSSANDGRFDWPAPAASRYQKTWTSSNAMDGGYGDVLVQGNVLYHTVWGGPGKIYPMLRASSLTTGDMAWEAPIMLNTPVMLTSHGLLAALPTVSQGETGLGQPFQIALLSHREGSVLWTSGYEFPASDDVWSNWLLASSTQLVVTSNVGTIVGIDLLTGDTDWVYRYERLIPDGYETSYCVEDGECMNRLDLPVTAVMLDSTLYFADQATYAITAFDVDDGSEVWRHTFSTHLPFPNPIAMGIMATRDGLVVYGRNNPEIMKPGVLQLWSAEKGDLLWSADAQILTSVVADNNGGLYFNDRPRGGNGTSTGPVVRIDIASGDKSVFVSSDQRVSVVRFLTESNSLVLSTNDYEAPFVGMDVGTREIDWTLALNQGQCSSLASVGDDGSVVCFRSNQNLTVYNPGETRATPELTASPVPFATLAPPTATID